MTWILLAVLVGEIALWLLSRVVNRAEAAADAIRASAAAETSASGTP